MDDIVDIAKLKRVNSLASTLTKHGISMNRLEAANLARTINGGEDMDYLNKLYVNRNQQMIGVVNGQAYNDNSNGQESAKQVVVDNGNGQQLVQEVPVQQVQLPKNILSKQETEAILQKFCDLFGDEIGKLNAKIEGLEIKFTYLQTQLAENEKRLNNGSHAETQTTLGSKESENNVKVEAKPAVVANNNSSSHPRTGNYNSDSVSIEKFFYYGNKR
ncbi:hypothetical protein J4434_05100 [Candidatus Woesearchaeota archaeon]|nr:hypothetical protein [Candidatus Woesearchaeota archaeon]